MKKNIGVFLILTILSLSATAHSQLLDVSENSVDIFVDNQLINENNFIVDGTTYVPLRVVSENLGADVIWDDAVRQINIISKTIDHEKYLGHCIKISDKLATCLDVMYHNISDMSSAVNLYSNYYGDMTFFWELYAKMNVSLTNLEDMSNVLEKLKSEYTVLISVRETPETQQINNTIVNTENYINECQTKINEIMDSPVDVIASNATDTTEWCNVFLSKVFNELQIIRDDVFNKSVDALIN